MTHMPIPANNVYKPQSIFNPSKQALLNHIPEVPAAHLARQRVKRLAGDLEAMIFGDVQ
ncbi:hypothetical protein ACIPY0_20415 [Paenarthrobacter nicotinovorans]|uniref:hypothetical protein n=1 Tax=Paenarthrobacter nicotinovorans TaxID=29320 RepID=UPI0037FB9827